MYAGLDIGGTSVKYGVVSEEGKILMQSSVPTFAEQGKDALLERLKSLTSALLSEYPDIRSVGVGVPGVVNPQDSCVYYPPNLAGWDIVPLRSILQAISPVPVALDNDANVAALAEAELGAGRLADNFLYVTLGTGVGGGIIANRQIFTGESGGAGEIGHVVINAFETPTEEQRSGGRSFRAGTLEEHIGRAGLLTMTQRYIAQYPNSSLSDCTEIDVKDINNAAEAGDTAATECLTEAGRLLGVGLASILAVLDMRFVVIGGGISRSKIMLDSAQETLRLRAIPTIARAVQIHSAHFGSTAGLVGAAMLGKRLV